MKKINSIFIFGLGHLSSFVLEELPEDLHVEGCYRSQALDKKAPLKKQFSYDFDNDPFPDQEVLKTADLVLWSYPPLEGYEKLLKHYDQFFDESVPWIFTSSTSVYKEGEVTEESPREGKSFRRANLVEIEDLLYSLKRTVTVLRPSGLVDEKRKPYKFFKDPEREIPLKGQTTNLVHTQDVARFIKHLIQDPKLLGEDFNLASKTTYEKSYFYTEVMKAHAIQPPKFVESESKSLKKVNSAKSRKTGFTYLHEDLLKTFN